MDDPDFGGVDPDDAFAALSDPARIDILRALWTAEERHLSFSALRERVGMRDSGRFNYHLDELVGRYVARTDDGYRLRLAGIKVVGSLFAGEHAAEDGIEPIPLDAPCPVCGGDRTFRYDGEWVTVECGDCEVYSKFGIPPGVFEGHDRERFPAVATRYARTLVRQVHAGFCPVCEGPVRPTIRTAGDDDADDRFDEVPAIEYDCDRCGESVTASVRVGLLDHPAVVAFYRDHGGDVREVPVWEVGTLDPDRAEFVDEDPIRARVCYEVDGEELAVVVDGEANVVDVQRD